MVCTFRLCMEDDDPNPDRPPWYQQSSVVPVNNANCGNDSCKCGDRYVARLCGVVRTLISTQQLQMRGRQLQVLNAHAGAHFITANFPPLNV